ncbi:F-box/LRR-repeat protein [Abeliophyllum distichum]|uniref:F-box/LRR-repeat protein n=1 Tax=Abeliophyllum distichum TaxID=126358 RepID=A0ABD1RGP4_9LAMI
MEYLPVEVVGHILSRLQAARDVVIASATCQKWREARRKHLCALNFDCNDWDRYRHLPIRELEILITRTIFQTSGLQSLSLYMDGNVNNFSAALVIAWLMYTRETLRELHYALRTDPLYQHSRNMWLAGARSFGIGIQYYYMGLS